MGDCGHFYWLKDSTSVEPRNGYVGQETFTEIDAVSSVRQLQIEANIVI